MRDRGTAADRRGAGPGSPIAVRGGWPLLPGTGQRTLTWGVSELVGRVRLGGGLLTPLKGRGVVTVEVHPRTRPPAPQPCEATEDVGHPRRLWRAQEIFAKRSQVSTAVSTKPGPEGGHACPGGFSALRACFSKPGRL